MFNQRVDTCSHDRDLSHVQQEGGGMFKREGGVMFNQGVEPWSTRGWSHGQPGGGAMFNHRVEACSTRGWSHDQPEGGGMLYQREEGCSTTRG